MENWFSYLLLALGAGLGLAVAHVLRQRRAERLRLRLVAGQSHLLSAQLAQRLSDLEAFEQQPLEEWRAAAVEALDELHVLLIERQAHLQNCEDLVHLQQQKVAWLAKTPRATPPARPARPAATASRQAKNPPPAATPPAPRRDHLEDQLLQQIDELNRKRRNPPPPPKK